MATHKSSSRPVTGEIKRNRLTYPAMIWQQNKVCEIYAPNLKYFNKGDLLWPIILPAHKVGLRKNFHDIWAIFYSYKDGYFNEIQLLEECICNYKNVSVIEMESKYGNEDTKNR